MIHNGSYQITPKDPQEAEKVEVALNKHNIPFSKNKMSKFTTLEIPEHALRAEGFLVWGDRFNLICRIRAVLRGKR